MTTHMIGTREERLAARLALLDSEKALARQRQELPWVRVDKKYQFGTDEGNAFLADVFRTRRLASARLYRGAFLNFLQHHMQKFSVFFSIVVIILC